MQINQYTRVDYINTSPPEQVKFSNQFVQNVPCSYNIVNLQPYTEIVDQIIDTEYVVTGNVLMQNCTIQSFIRVADGCSLYIVGGVLGGGLITVTLGNNAMAILTDGSNLDFISEIYPVTIYGNFGINSVATEPAYGYYAGQLFMPYLEPAKEYLELGVGGGSNMRYDASKVSCVDPSFNFFPIYFLMPGKTVDFAIIPPTNIPYRMVILET